MIESLYSNFPWGRPPLGTHASLRQALTHPLRPPSIALAHTCTWWRQWLVAPLGAVSSLCSPSFSPPLQFCSSPCPLSLEIAVQLSAWLESFASWQGRGRGFEIDGEQDRSRFRARYRMREAHKLFFLLLKTFNGISTLGAYCSIWRFPREKVKGKCVMGVERSKDTVLYWGLKIWRILLLFLWTPIVRYPPSHCKIFKPVSHFCGGLETHCWISNQTRGWIATPAHKLCLRKGDK